MALLFGILLIGALFRHGVVSTISGSFKIIGVLLIAGVAIHIINFIVGGVVFGIDSVSDLGAAIDFKNLFVIEG